MNSSHLKGEAVYPIRCLVIQLARLGDTLQCLMALRAAKQLYPQLEIHFLVREKFSAAAYRVPWIKEIISMPTDSLLAPILSGEKTESQGVSDLAKWLSPIAGQSWDFIINWTYSEASSYLAGLLIGRVKLGYTRRRDGSFLGADGWSHYIQAMVQGGASQNIHLTDILTTQILTALQIHVGEPALNGDAAVTSKSFFKLKFDRPHEQLIQLDSQKKWISFQIGCGHESKTWSPKKWAKLAHLIQTRHPDFGIVVLGGSEDELKAKEFLNEVASYNSEPIQGILCLVGQTSFDSWAAIIAKSQWLISGDTAAIHLASVLGTRVLNISVGPVRFLETGPYGNGHYLITSYLDCEGCSKGSYQMIHTCREVILPELVYGVWLYGHQEWSHFRTISLENYLSQLEWPIDLSPVQIYRSKIRSSNDGGGVLYEVINHQMLKMSQWTALVMGHVARSWYCGWTPPVGQELQRKLIGSELIHKLRLLQESTEVLSKIFLRAEKAAIQMNKTSAALKSENIMRIRDREELQELGKTLADLENLIERVIKTQPVLIGFYHMVQILMHHLRGNQIFELSRETANSYKQLNDGLEIFQQWIKFTLNLVRPIAVKSNSWIDSSESLPTLSEKDLM